MRTPRSRRRSWDGKRLTRSRICAAMHGVGKAWTRGDTERKARNRMCACH